MRDDDDIATRHREIKNVCGGATPVVLCGNKADKMQLNHTVPVVTAAATSINKDYLRYCELSAAGLPPAAAVVHESRLAHEHPSVRLTV